jgi:hypothetical protein
MKSRLKKKIWAHFDDPKLHYTVNQRLCVTSGLFVTPIKIGDNFYYKTYYCGKIEKNTRL